MQIFLIRHAHAVDTADDPERPLSKRGRNQVRRLARFLDDRDALQFREVWHTPLARSRETAKLFVKQLGLDAKLVEVQGLEGGDDPALVAERLKTRRTSLALVGHEPHLSALASLLVAGVAEPPRFILKKSSIVALQRTGGNWAVCWHISPELLAK